MLYKDNNPDQTWIVFISILYENKSLYHHAEDLVQEVQHNNLIQFGNEYLFEKEILEEYIIHKVLV
jgi:hypothetical protein